jgi:hypothetical protein
MAVPILIFVACLAVGVSASARWLPNLAAGSVGGLAFFAVCGLIGAGLALIGVNVYEIVEAVNKVSTENNGDVVAIGLRAALFESGSVFGLAMIVYLLAPAPDEDVVAEPPE